MGVVLIEVEITAGKYGDVLLEVITVGGSGRQVYQGSFFRLLFFMWLVSKNDVCYPYYKKFILAGR